MAQSAFVRLAQRATRVLLASLAITTPVFAQVPDVHDIEKFGRKADNFALHFCIDPRDPAWQVDEEIGKAIASALLIEPKETVIKDPSNQNDIDDMYRHLLADCDVYFGFKLIANGYPDWLTITRPYYSVGYSFFAKDPTWKQLSDIPKTQPLGPTVGTTGDFRLIQYLNSLPGDQRWDRFPMSNDQMALQSVIDGTVGAALIWAPSYAALVKANPAFTALHQIGPAPLPQSTVPVGAVLLSQNTFLRSNMDQAIASLVKDGTIAGILAKYKFPATLPQ
jgi:polar amino acid transport system substrate-binding protein